MNSYSEMWEAVCNIAQSELGLTENAVKAWLKPMSIVAFDGQAVVLSCENEFMCSMTEKLYKPTIQRALEIIIGIEVEIEFRVKEEPLTQDNKISQPDSSEKFDNFIVGKSNDLAYAAAQKVAKDPGGTYNPFFIYGKSGLGKTHLLKAIENEILKNNPSANIIYTTSENFTNDLIYHLQNKNQYEFREKYRKVDVLLIDDIQFIAGKEKTEEEFFHTFEALYQYNKQIVLASDRPPNEMQILNDRLKTRFVMGLMVDVQTPDLETRMAIIKNKAEQYNFEISNEIVEFVATELKNNVRQLEGAIKRIKNTCELRNTKPTLEIAKDAIKEFTSYSVPVSVIVQKIIENVGNTYGVSKDNILSEKRDKNIKDARQVAMYIIREITGMSYQEIGNYFGGKIHTTVRHSVNQVALNMEKDFTFKKTIEDLIKDIKE